MCFPPPNGQVNCGSGLVNMGLEGNTYTFSCNPGYMLQGSVTSGTCENTGSWSGGLPSCVPLNCPDRIVFSDDSELSPLFPLCNLEYQSECPLGCAEGFTGNNVTYLCSLTNDLNIVEWMPIGGIDLACEPGEFA